MQSLFNKVAGHKACNFIKRRLQHRCFPVNFAKFLRTPILKNVCERASIFMHKYAEVYLGSGQTFINGIFRENSKQLLLLSIFTKKLHQSTAWKVSKYGVFSGPVFFCIRTEYGDLRSKSPYSVRIQENMDQKKLCVWTLFTRWRCLTGSQMCV